MLCMVITGCDHVHGRPGPGPDVPRPEEVVDFHTLYKQNCAGCHGVEGRGGAAIALANPVYLSYAGERNIAHIIASGVPEKLMPPFAKTAGGMLTDRQILAIAQGVMTEWNKPALMAGQSIPAYSSSLTGDSGRGQRAFVVSCARCHGATGEAVHPGSIVDPTYLALVSDQYLRGVTVAGSPDGAMPDWRSDSAQPLTDQEITDIVAWLASQRVANPGQPYSSHP
jgi:cytochrome c oxidase cbb3-type subunit 3/ubiquinol-cytochrome c reductase cytochrome c subunit